MRRIIHASPCRLEVARRRAMLPHRNKWLPRHGLGPYVREDRADAVLLTMPPLNWRWQLRYRWWVTLLIVAVWICITYPVDHRSIWWQIGALSLAEAYLLVRSTIGLEIFVADDELIARSYCAFWDRTRRWHRCEVGAVRWNGLYSTISIHHGETKSARFARLASWAKRGRPHLLARCGFSLDSESKRGTLMGNERCLKVRRLAGSARYVCPAR
jgi:hypothetical protein